MPVPPQSARVPKAEQVDLALGVVAALAGAGREQLFEPRRPGMARARIAAAAGLQRAGFNRGASAAVCKVDTTWIAPSALATRKVPPEWVAAVSEALGGPSDAPAPVKVRPAKRASDTPCPGLKASRRADRRGRAAPVAPAAAPVAAPQAVVPALKPVNGRIVGWARRMLARPGVWSLSEIAQVFEVRRDDLGVALARAGL